MKRSKRSIGLIVLFIMSFVLVGCLDGNKLNPTKDQTILEFLEEVAIAYISMDSEKAVDLWYYPFSVEWSEGHFEEVTKEKAKVWATEYFSFWKSVEYLTEEYVITLSDEDDGVVISNDGKTAVLNGAILTEVVRSEEGSFGSERLLEPLALKKVGLKWKFDGFNSILFLGVG